MKPYDLIVLGVGGIGSSIVAQAAQRGLRVLGLEQYSVPHRRGSSHGITRILRLGLHEGQVYTPLARRALELWNDLGRKTGTELFHNTGSLEMALPTMEAFKKSLAACSVHSVNIEILSEAEIRHRFPGITPDPGMVGLLQKDAGYVLSDVSIQVHLTLALNAGAELHGHEKFLDWTRKGELYTITTDRATYETKSVVVAAGAWAGKLLKDFGIPIRGDRQILGWFQPTEATELFTPSRLPVWIINSEDLGHFYGLPIHSIPGLKVAKFFLGEVVDPDEPLLPVQRQEEESLRVFLKRFFPKANGPVTTLASMFFESTPDRDFVIDRLPGEENFWIAAGFSGHGFKYVPAIGELLADLVSTGVSSRGFDLSPFRIARFGNIEDGKLGQGFEKNCRAT